MTATATTYAASYNSVRTGPFSYTLVGSNIQYLTEASFEGKGIIVGCTITTAGFSNATVNSIQDNGAYYTIILSVAASGPIYSGTTLTFSLGGASATKTSILYFTKSTWEASGAVNGTLIDDAKFPKPGMNSKTKDIMLTQSPISLLLSAALPNLTMFNFPVSPSASYHCPSIIIPWCLLT